VIAVLDTEAINALAPSTEQSRARLRALRRRADDLIIPTAVLAEGVLTGHPGHDHHVRTLLNVLSMVDVDVDLGLAAGSMRHQVGAAGAKPLPSGVDALVAALADRRASRDDVMIMTSDPDDLRVLAASGVHPQRVSVLHTSLPAPPAKRTKRGR
jgi:hypothetical protein